MGLPRYKNLCSRIINIPLPYGMRLKVSPEGRHIFERLWGFKCVEKSIDGTTLACGFLKKKDVGAGTELRRVSEERRDAHSRPKTILALEGT
jgi:hypothetical protein